MRINEMSALQQKISELETENRWLRARIQNVESRTASNPDSDNDKSGQITEPSSPTQAATEQTPAPPVVAPSPTAITDSGHSGTDDVAPSSAMHAFSLSTSAIVDILDLIPQPLFIKDAGGRYRFVNQAFLSWRGGVADDYLSKSDFELFSKEAGHKYRKLDAQALDAKTSLTYEDQVTSTDGSPRSFVAHRGRVRLENEEMGIVGYVEDITMQRKFARELEIMRYSVEHAGDRILWLRRDGRIDYVNHITYRSLGYTREELLSMTVMDLNPDITEHWDEIWETIKAQGVLVDEATQLAKDGSVQPIEVTSSYQNFDGEEYIFAFARDVTERKRNEAAMREAKEAAEAAAEAKANFLAIMSHEIRTPMNGVIGMASLLRATELTDEQKDYVETIWSSGDTLLTIIDDILDFSKIEAGKIGFESRPFDLRSCIQDVLDLVSHSAVEKGLALPLNIQKHVPVHILGDVTRLRQILLNLLSNAIKFTPTGSVTLSVELWQPKLTSVDPSHRMPQLQLCFSIKDTGIGIPEERIDSLFESFNQGDSSTTRRFGGTGLGLTISKRLTEGMGGTMWVESTPDVGSTFYFTIATQAISQPTLSEGMLLPPTSQNHEFALRYPLRILLAEDNLVNQKVASQLLHRMGYEIDVVENGAEAVEAALQNSYDLVLMDIHMPEMDGLEATRRIIEQLPVSSAPTIAALTAGVLEEDRARCFQVGMRHFISKPFKLETLKSIVARVYIERTSVAQFN